jgi:hypothetical protein
MSNLCDDWGAFYYKCANCGQWYHASEGCDCEEEDEPYGRDEDAYRDGGWR